MGITTGITTDMQIGMVPSPLAWEHWPSARAFLDPALMESDEDWSGVEHQLAIDHAQLWAVLRDGALIASAITRMVHARTGMVVEVFLVGGHGFRDWIAALHHVIAMAAQSEGCVGMRAYGRAGWRDVLKRLGWRMSFVGYETSFTGATGQGGDHR